MAIPPKQRTNRVPGEVIQDEDIDGIASAINDLIDEVVALREAIEAGGGTVGGGDGEPSPDVTMLEARVLALEAVKVVGRRWDAANRRYVSGGLELNASPWDSSATTPPAPASGNDALWADA